MSSPPTLTLPDGTALPVPEDGEQSPRAPHHTHTPPHPNRMLQHWEGRTREQPFKKLTWSHMLAIDLMIEHPEWTGKDLAGYFGHSEHWVSLVINSDGFQAKLAERRDEVLNPEVKATIEERFRTLANASLDRLHKKLENPNASDNLVLRSVELAAKALGLGIRPPPPSNSVQIAIVVPPKATL